jgi:hypothetical protein
MAAKKKAATLKKPKVNKTNAKKASPRTKKQATSSAPGEAAQAHKWLVETQLKDAIEQAASDDLLDDEPVSEPARGEHLKPYHWKPGQSGNPAGRKKGSRSKFAEAFLTDFLNDWEQHGAEAIVVVRETKPDQYLKVAAAILPKQMDVRVSEFAELKEDALDAKIEEMAKELSTALAILQPARAAH